LPPTFISEVVDGVARFASILLLAASTSDAADRVVPEDNARWPPLLMLRVPSSEPLPVTLAPVLTLTWVLASDPLRFRVPPSTAVLPTMPLIPVRFRVPVPTLVRPPLPLRSPSKVLVLLTPPTVNVLPPAICTLPLPLKPSRLASLPRLRLAPALILAPEVLPRAPLLRVVTLPAAMFSAPVKVLVPLRARSSRPVLVRLPAPSITPLRVSPLLPARVSPASRVMLLPRVKALLLSSVAAPPTVRVPLPKAPCAPTVRVPALRVLPPL